MLEQPTQEKVYLLKEKEIGKEEKERDKEIQIIVQILLIDFQDLTIHMVKKNVVFVVMK